MAAVAWSLTQYSELIIFLDNYFNIQASKLKQSNAYGGGCKTTNPCPVTRPACNYSSYFAPALRG